MLILLPPSEGKTDPATGRAVDLQQLVLPGLSDARGNLLDAVVQLARGPRARARAVLGVSQRQDAEVERDAELRTAPAARAGHVYTGVLYDALGYQSLLPAVRRRADQSVWVMSALFGVVRLGDPIPAYRLSADVTLPRLGRVGTWWRPRLHTTLDEAVGGRALLDLRSGSYGAMWAPSGDISDRMAVGRVLQRLPDGSTKVVSHHNKATKGRLVRALLQRPVRARSPEAIADAVESCGFSTRYEPPAAGRPARIDIVVELP